MSISQISNESEPLAAIKHAVDQCRQGCLRPTFPEPLKLQIVEQLDHYRISELSRAIGVGANCLTRWRQSFQNNLNHHERVNEWASKPCDSFVSLPLQQAAEDRPQIPVTIELGTERHPRQYRLQANIDRAVFDQLLQRIAQALVA